MTEEKLILMDIDKEDNDKLPQPSWETLSLLGSYIDPKSLAIASCVSSSCSQCFSSENLWKFKQNSYEPFNFAAAKETKERISYKRLVSTVESAAKKRKKHQPREPKISLSDLVFTVYVSTGLKEATVVRKGEDMVFSSNERFEIEADVSKSGIYEKELRVVWQVMFRDYEKIFTILDSTTRSSSSSVDLGWFTKELPTPENSYLGGSNLVGDVKPCFDGDALVKVRLGIVNSSTWSSLFLDDVLRYLQCFLLH